MADDPREEGERTEQLAFYLAAINALVRRERVPLEELPAERGARPQLTRWYESSTLDPATGAGFRILVLPRRPEELAYQELGLVSPDVKAAWADAVDLETDPQLDVHPRQLLDALLVTGPDHAPTYEGDLRRSETILQGDSLTASSVAVFGAFAADRDPALAAFTARVATEAIVPIEESAPRGVSLHHLMGGVGANAVLAYGVSTRDAVLIISVPVAIVIIGGARGVAAGLQEGLYRRIVKALTGKDPGLQPPPKVVNQPRPPRGR
jgi:hypothetical protein